MQARTPSKAPSPIRVTVPNRVDLAGGTLDIYPLYLLVPGSMTVNAAITVHSVVRIAPVRGPSRLCSENFSLAEEAPDTHGFSAGGRLGLVAAALRFFPPVAGVEIRFRNEAPLGSGLGASSALLVATMLAMDALSGRRRGWEETARAAMEIEAAHLRSLAGRQDHVAALRGGVLGIRFRPGGLEAERIGAGSREARRLAAHGFVAGTGKAHRSAEVNWRMIRGAIEGRREVLRKFRGIAAAAREAWEAVRCGEMAEAGRAVGREWAIRKTLARGVSTSRVEKALADGRFRRRVAGAKLCGAGGGGMLFGLLRGPEDRDAVEAFLRTEGFSVYPFRLSGGPRVVRAETVSGIERAGSAVP
jgi:D-glycero-alpha-D-manno-heptose-7-phosphate kinase